jgi:hypothetical protein
VALSDAPSAISVSYSDVEYYTNGIFSACVNHTRLVYEESTASAIAEPSVSGSHDVLRRKVDCPNDTDCQLDTLLALSNKPHLHSFVVLPTTQSSITLVYADVSCFSTARHSECTHLATGEFMTSKGRTGNYFTKGPNMTEDDVGFQERDGAPAVVAR